MFYVLKSLVVYIHDHSSRSNSGFPASGLALAPQGALGKTKVWVSMHYMLSIYMACPYVCNHITLRMYNCCFCTKKLFVLALEQY